MAFEYDANKSNSNREKHGIDFDLAQALWVDEDRIEIPAKTQGEPRILVIENQRKTLVRCDHISR